MAVITVVPGGTNVELVSTFKPLTLISAVTEAPGGLYPLMSAAWDMDDYRVRYGWPVEVPGHDIHAQTLVSISGEILSARDDPTSLLTNAYLRWTADGGYYDRDALIWSPVQGPPDAVWRTSTTYAPELIYDYEYRINDEKFTMVALNFDSDTRNHMWQDFSNILTGTIGYTVIFVMNPNSLHGNDQDVPYNGLWCPGRATPGGTSFAETTSSTWISATMQGNYIYLETETYARQLGVPMNPQLNATTPAYIAISFARPQTTMYVANGPSSIISKTLNTGATTQSMDYGVLLGRSTGDVLHTADMALLDVGIYADVLTASEIQQEFVALSSVYGGDS